MQSKWKDLIEFFFIFSLILSLQIIIKEFSLYSSLSVGNLLKYSKAIFLLLSSTKSKFFCFIVLLSLSLSVIYDTIPPILLNKLLDKGIPNFSVNNILALIAET